MLQVPRLWGDSDVRKMKTSPRCVFFLCLSAATGLWASADQIAVDEPGVTGCRWHRSLCLRCPCCPSLPGPFLLNLMPALTALLVKSRGLLLSGEGLEILTSSFIKGIQRDFCWARTERSSGRKAADWKSNPFFLLQLLIGFKLTASVAIDFYQRPLHGTY